MPTASTKRILKCYEAIREGLDQSLEADERVFIVGEGVPDPKGVFGTTLGLREKYGSTRVWDMPVSENGLTGACIGAAISGLRPVLTHQRLDFALLSLDQIINNAAKWYYMFGGQQSVPIVVRMVIGHGWGQGAQHSQNLQAIFAHIPGLKVVMPATAYDAKGLLIASIEDPNPVIFLEHRWIHGLIDEVPRGMYRIELGKASVARDGRQVTIVASSYMTIQSLRAAEILQEEGISAEVVDLRTISPLDEETILASVRKTGRLLVVDSGTSSGGIAGEIITRVATKAMDSLRQPPQRVALPDIPAPSSPALTKSYYPTYQTIVEAVFRLMHRSPRLLKSRWRKEEAIQTVPHDVPDTSFTGPF
jgi:acetoin:2,6-dichlorophenolindophenol oxidoreductase subunit beta